MRSVIASPLFPAQHVHLVHAVEQARPRDQLVVERRLERDRDATFARDRPALTSRRSSTSTSLGSRTCPSTWNRPPSSSSNSPAQPAASRTGPSRAPSFGPRTRQVRFHAQFRRGHLSEDDLLDSKLVGDLVRVRRGSGAPSFRAAAAAAGASDRALVPRTPSQLDDAANVERPRARERVVDFARVRPRARGAPTRTRNQRRRCRQR